jgi:hypothetical protein
MSNLARRSESRLRRCKRELHSVGAQPALFGRFESAVTIYDDQRIVDYLRWIDEETIMGAMPVRGDDRISFFELERVDGP